ncbi:MAG: hypothetical protein J3K34DRAFT_422571 [Monoraphidium minutum]|nr:MAG: hypothetical protein J3K34DRAFT_422571 [Monoraphidium minutum]
MLATRHWAGAPARAWARRAEERGALLAFRWAGVARPDTPATRPPQRGRAPPVAGRPGRPPPALDIGDGLRASGTVGAADSWRRGRGHSREVGQPAAGALTGAGAPPGPPAAAGARSRHGRGSLLQLGPACMPRARARRCAWRPRGGARGVVWRGRSACARGEGPRALGNGEARGAAGARPKGSAEARGRADRARPRPPARWLAAGGCIQRRGRARAGAGRGWGRPARRARLAAKKAMSAPFETGDCQRSAPRGRNRAVIGEGRALAQPKPQAAREGGGCTPPKGADRSTEMVRTAQRP